MDKQKLLLAALEDVKTAVGNLETMVREQSNVNGLEENSSSKPTEGEVITLEQVRAVLAAKSQAGLSAEIKALIQTCGADKLTDVDPKHYESLIKAAEAM